MQTNYLALIPSVIRIAEAAGEVIMEVYEQADFGVEEKEDFSPVTKADTASNDLICKLLQELAPNIPIISEEGFLPDFSERKTYASYWLLDPLDGTKEFINRNGEFTVNIALMENNQPVLGISHLPVLKETYWGAKGEGAWCIKNGIARRLKADTFTMEQSGLAIAVTRSHFNQATSDYIGGFAFPRLIAKGSSLKVIMVAAGEAHLHPRFGTTMEWDTAAPQIILQEAGGKIVQHDGSPLEYNKEDLRNPSYFAYGNVR
jgi:3'(2'), 5'-bisphosphate nucleotidase